jgi:hypothetical protein
MVQNRQKHSWMMIAFLAIACSLVLLVALHSASGAPDFAAILPLLVVGILSPLSLFAVLTSPYVSRIPQSPVLAVAFVRPPPRR